MHASDSSDAGRARFSLLRVVLTLLPFFIAGGIASYYVKQLHRTVRARGEQSTASSFGLAGEVSPARLDPRYTDADSNLVADAPEDAASHVDPNPLVFSYIAASESAGQPEVWKPLLAALGEAIERPVEFRAYATTAEQLEALRQGDLHVTGFNTGSVPEAVNASGFVPVVTLGRADGRFGYTMNLIVPAASPLKGPADVRGHKVMFTHKQSNSGFKAAVLMLRDEHELLPERDYRWGFTLGHEESIRRTADGQFDVAPVASDMLERAIARRDVEPDAVRSIYVSDPFPPAAIGYAHDLEPGLAEKIRGLLVGFSIEGTPLAEELGAERLVAVDYRRDWDAIRRIDAAMALPAP